MSANRAPDTEPVGASILFVDDEPDGLRADVAAGLDDRVQHEVIHPRDVCVGHLESADLVLVDFRLENWNERDNQPDIALQPATGMALAVVLREHVDRSQKDRLTAFALHSAHLNEVRGRLPTTRVQHLLARLNNLEWVFPKTESQRYEQMVILAEAVRQLPRRWPGGGDDAMSEVKSLLDMDLEVPSFDRCWREVQECQAPVHELRDEGHGLLFVRWLLHQVMPYPCFLSEAHWVAARLRVSVDELQAVIDGGSQLAQDLQAIRYSGILAGFLGERWWHGALEDYVWEITGGRTGDAQRLRDGLRERAGREFTSIKSDPPVVCLNADLQPAGEFGTPATAVRLRPDHWPAFADAAWMDISTVQEDPTLAAMVHPLDQERIGTEDEE